MVLQAADPGGVLRGGFCEAQSDVPLHLDRQVGAWALGRDTVTDGTLPMVTSLTVVQYLLAKVQMMARKAGIPCAQACAQKATGREAIPYAQVFAQKATE